MAKFRDELQKPCSGGVCEAWAEDHCNDEESLPKCPRCNEEVRVLLTNRPAVVFGKVAYNYEADCLEDVEPEFIDDAEEIDEHALVVFSCPHCNNPIFDCSEKAEEFFFDYKMHEEEVQEPYKS